MGRNGGFQSVEKLTHWRETLSQWKASGQSIRAYCAAQGISEQRFYYWKRIVAAADAAKVPAATAGWSAGRDTAAGSWDATGASPRLVPLHLVAPAGGGQGSRPTIEVEWPRGVIVRSTDQVDAEALLRVLQAVEALQAGAR